MDALSRFVNFLLDGCNQAEQKTAGKSGSLPDTHDDTPMSLAGQHLFECFR